MRGETDEWMGLGSGRDSDGTRTARARVRVMDEDRAVLGDARVVPPTPGFATTE